MILQEIAQFLDNEGVGTYVEEGVTGDIFIDILPDKECMALMHTGGSPALIGSGYQTPNFQILYRGNKNPITSSTKAWEIYNTLNGFSGYFINSGHYVVSCLGIQNGPIHLEIDNNSRHVYSINFSLDYKE